MWWLMWVFRFNKDGFAIFAKKKYVMDGLSKLQKEYLKIFETFKPVLDDMHSHWSLYPEYLGWFDLGSPIFEQPDILFVGINPGPGRFRLWNYKKPKESQKIPDDFPTPWRSELHWTKDGVAREGKWYDKSSRHRNLFPNTLCELLVRIYRPYFPEYSREMLTGVFQQRIMSTNLFPMVTIDKSKLDKLLKKYKDVSNNHTDITTLCISNFAKLIDLVSPKLVVLLGKTLEMKLKSVIEEKGIHYVCVDRTRGWHSKKRIADKASEIRNLLPCLR